MAPILLDISRTISRADHPVPTGIDRVELAYIDHFLPDDREAWFLTRIAGGFALLDQAQMQYILPMILGENPWGKKDLIARLFGRKKPEMLRRAESTIRRLARTNGKNQLTTMLRKNVPKGFSYVNVGHANRKTETWNAIRSAGASRMVAMVHDVIPLDFPEFTRRDMQSRFAAELKETATQCDCLIYNSTDTKNRAEHWLTKWDVPCDSVTALLGVKPLPDQPVSQLSEHPYFVILGTIEPRKNHRLLLDIWQKWPSGGPQPHLYIVGRRGWLNEAVFNMLDTADMMGKTVFEKDNMDDIALSKLLGGARALLFPSFAEGFGYPLVEALQKKIPVICSNLPCFQEISGDLPIYLNPEDKKGWENAILHYSQATKPPNHQESPNIPTWNEHFLKIDTVL